MLILFLLYLTAPHYYENVKFVLTKEKIIGVFKSLPERGTKGFADHHPA